MKQQFEESKQASEKLQEIIKPKVKNLDIAWANNSL